MLAGRSDVHHTFASVDVRFTLQRRLCIWNGRRRRSFCLWRGEPKEFAMKKFRNAVLVATLMGSVALLGTPTFAVEPDTDSPAGPELPAPRTDRPDFQQ